MIALLGGPLAPTASMGRKLGGWAGGQASAAAKNGHHPGGTAGKKAEWQAGRQAYVISLTKEEGECVMSGARGRK